MNAFSRILVGLVLLLTSAQILPASAAAPTADTSAYYIILRRQADSSIQAVSCQQVEMSAPLVSMDHTTLQKALKVDGDGYIVRLLDDTKQVQYQTTARIPTLLRGEFQETETMPLKGYFIDRQVAAFVVRVPVIPGSTLTLTNSKGTRQAQFSLEELGCGAPLKHKSVYPVLPIQINGPSQNRVDILILGDGYTAAESAKFMNDATLFTNGFFFQSTPLTEYRSYFNVFAIDTPSTESGADHPPYNAGCIAGDPTCCGDFAMTTDPLQGQFRNTMYDSTYCYWNIHRLLVALDETEVFIVAANKPDWDAIVVIVNDSTYGGSGGNIAVLSTNAAGIEIGKHEFGHSFGLLADEYDIGTPIACDDTDTDSLNDCPVNVTNATTRPLIKWSKWIPIDVTTFPSPEDGSYPYAVGLFQGAYYDPTNMYRPGLNCLMQTLYTPFCQVPSETLVARLYQGGWGDPISGIDMIEPGTELPATTTVNMILGQTEIFKATLLNPLVPISTSWLIDGVVQAGFFTNSFPFNPAVPGTYTISLMVLDTGPFIHPLDFMVTQNSQYTWNVNVLLPTYLPLVSR